MVTIIVDTKDEYDKVREFAQNFVCRQMSFARCGTYPPTSCDKCFEDNHVKYGIRVIPPVDSNNPNKL